MAPPSKFSHVVFRTHQYQTMIDWYAKVFEAKVQHAGERMTFITYDDEHHRFAFMNMGPAEDGEGRRKASDVGMHHLCFTWADVPSLIDTYRRLKAEGVEPAVPLRHGMSLSLYYADPDGNMVELSADVLTMQEATDFMQTTTFAANPAGDRFDPAEIAARLEAGQPYEDLIYRADQQAAE